MRELEHDHPVVTPKQRFLRAVRAVFDSGHRPTLIRCGANLYADWFDYLDSRTCARGSYVDPSWRQHPTYANIPIEIDDELPPDGLAVDDDYADATVVVVALGDDTWHDGPGW